MEQDLLETGGKVLKNDPSLEKGSSAFNRVLLKEFLKLYPKCMESSRSLYSKLQSIEKDEAKGRIISKTVFMLLETSLNHQMITYRKIYLN